MLCGGCSDAMEDIIDAPSESLTLRFYSAGAGTRADIESSDASLNENLISNLAVAFYPSAASDSKNAVKFNLFKNLGATGKVERKIIISDEEVALLFGSTETSGATCRVYALANLSDEEIAALGKTPTVAAMKELRVSSEFDTQQVQESFVMSGDATVTYNIDASGKKTAVGNVQLVRSAAKITLNIKLPESYEDPGTGNIWEPIASPATGAMRVLLNNGVKNSRVLVPQEGYGFQDEDYFNITTADATYGFVDNRVNNSEYPNKQKVPFYTYPNRWENTPGERHRTALTLIVPWHNTTTNTYQTFYYRVPVTPAEMPRLVSNHSYQIDLNVGMLGSAMPETPVEITGNYRVVDWARETIDVNIKDYRYLVVSPTTYRMDNTEDFTLNFYSSHPVEVDDITMTYQRFSYITETGNADAGAVVYFPTSKEVIDRSVMPDGIKMVEYSKNITIAPNSKQYSFSLRHKLEVWTPLNSATATSITNGNTVSQTGYTSLSDTTRIQNSIQKYLRSDSPDMPYSPYAFKVTLRHKDNPEFKASFTVVQYPAMYIQADKNPGGGTSNKGNVFVNNSNNSTSELGGVHGLTGSGNRNPNMYVIQTSVLGNTWDKPYIIGDPRSLNINNDLETARNSSGGYRPTYTYDPLPVTGSSAVAGSWCNTATALYPSNSGNRKLSYYYPTDERTEETHTWMIAPKIRVASSYGVTNPLNRTDARRRCATYQERGFPAGRWRLPTYGEMLYITSLSSTGKIPVLFSIGSTYWCAQGAYKVNSDGTLTEVKNFSVSFNLPYVRAVYDEWYWEKETNYVLQNNSSGGYDFTWGDMPMRNPQN